MKKNYHFVFIGHTIENNGKLSLDTLDRFFTVDEDIVEDIKCFVNNIRMWNYEEIIERFGYNLHSLLKIVKKKFPQLKLVSLPAVIDETVMLTFNF